MKPPKTRLSSYRFGLAAERLAAFYLLLKGYRVLALRYRNSGGEVDIVARRGKMVVAVEVKARQTMAACADSITEQKKQRLMQAANGLLSGQGKVAGLEDVHTCNIRFDVIWIVPWRLPIHIKDAWR